MNRILAVAILSLVVLAMGAGDRSFAAGEQKKDPVRFKVLNTFQTDLEGVDKAQLIQFEMDPGAEVQIASARSGRDPGSAGRKPLPR